MESPHRAAFTPPGPTGLPVGNTVQHATAPGTDLTKELRPNSCLAQAPVRMQHAPSARHVPYAYPYGSSRVLNTVAAAAAPASVKTNTAYIGRQTTAVRAAGWMCVQRCTNDRMPIGRHAHSIAGLQPPQPHPDTRPHQQRTAMATAAFEVQWYMLHLAG